MGAKFDQSFFSILRLRCRKVSVLSFGGWPATVPASAMLQIASAPKLNLFESF